MTPTNPEAGLLPLRKRYIKAFNRLQSFRKVAKEFGVSERAVGLYFQRNKIKIVCKAVEGK